MIQQNTYYIHTPLFVLDIIRMFQDHPQYRNGLKQCDIVRILEQEKFSNGDLKSQVESAIKNLEMSGYVRYVDNKGYRTLGPLAKLAKAKSPKQRTIMWNKIKEKF